jgi:hypothetical protein
VFLGFGQPAKIGQGYALYPGTQPLLIDHHDIGESIMQDIFGISENAGETVAFLEITE